MPTGYTSGLYDGEQTFEDFITGVARGMGYTIMQRDEATSSKPRLRRFNEYELKSLKEDVDQLYDYLSKTPKERYQVYLSKRQEHNVYKKKSQRERRAMRKRYENMLEQVRAWDIPEILESTRDYAIQQLESSIDFDCSEYDWKFPTYTSWKQEQESLRSLKRHAEYIEEEVERVQETNERILALYQSINT